MEDWQERAAAYRPDLNGANRIHELESAIKSVIMLLTESMRIDPEIQKAKDILRGALYGEL